MNYTLFTMHPHLHGFLTMYYLVEENFYYVKYMVLYKLVRFVSLSYCCAKWGGRFFIFYNARMGWCQ